MCSDLGRADAEAFQPDPRTYIRTAGRMYVQTCFLTYETQLSICWCFWYSGMRVIRACIPSSLLSGLFSFQLGPRESSLPRNLRRDSFSTLFMKRCGRGGSRRTQCSSITVTASATHHSGRTVATPAATAVTAAATAVGRVQWSEDVIKADPFL